MVSRQKLARHELTGAKKRIAATLGHVRKDVFRLARAQQALFAYLDTLAKALLTWRAGTAHRGKAASSRAGEGAI